MTGQRAEQSSRKKNRVHWARDGQRTSHTGSAWLALPNTYLDKRRRSVWQTTFLELKRRVLRKEPGNRGMQKKLRIRRKSAS
jgi:hypothetical protein